MSQLTAVSIHSTELHNHSHIELAPSRALSRHWVSFLQRLRELSTVGEARKEAQGRGVRGGPRLDLLAPDALPVKSFCVFLLKQLKGLLGLYVGKMVQRESTKLFQSHG